MLFVIAHVFNTERVVSTVMVHATLCPKWNSFGCIFGYPNSMKRSELTNKQKLSVPCPTCAAAIGQQCKMYSGLGRRKEPHAERKYQALQAIEDADDQYKKPLLLSSSNQFTSH
jgi:hypothetical protein